MLTASRRSRMASSWRLERPGRNASWTRAWPDRGGVAEGRHGAIPLLLLVVDRAELDPDARVARRGLRQRLDLFLRLLEAAEPDQPVAQPLDEGDILRVGLQRLPVDLESLLDRK